MWDSELTAYKRIHWVNVALTVCGFLARLVRTERIAWYASVTAKGFPVPTVVCKHAKGMDEPWVLASSLGDAKPVDLLKYYAKRWSIESYFRDTKDLRFGLGMEAIHTRSTDRRDRLFLLSALAIVLLTLLGAACEKVGYDRYLKSNTVKTRTHSLFRQG